MSAELRALIEEIAAQPDRRRGSSAQQIADLYASLMDEASLARRGADPIRPQLLRIAAATTPCLLAAEAGRLSSSGNGGPFAAESVRDAGLEGGMVVRLSQGGTLLPEPRYYLDADDRLREIRGRYEAYLARLFALAGRNDSAAAARAVLALEMELARAQTPSVPPRRYTLTELRRAMPGFDWMAWAKPQGIDRASALVLLQPSFFERFAALWQSQPPAAWQDWLAARYVTACAPFLNNDFSDARFELFGRLLSGQELPRIRWQRGVSLVNGYLGDALGRLYVERHFPTSSRARAQKLAANVLEAQRQALRAADWIGASTRREALHKLARLRVRVGWPDAWRDYSALEIRQDDLLGNIERARRLEATRRESGRGEWWPIPVQATNAAYDPAANEIVLPAALLQPPFFDPDADDAANYGAIGALLGHEITHALTGRGSETDGAGAARRWWAAADEQAFARRLARLVRPERTLSEDAADLCGLSVAFRAYALSLQGRQSPVLDGLRGEQRFFLSWARVWRARIRDEYLEQWPLQAPHAPPQQRVNEPAAHLGAFHEAFGTRPGDRLYRRPGERVVFW